MSSLLALLLWWMIRGCVVRGVTRGGRYGTESEVLATRVGLSNKSEVSPTVTVSP